MRDFRKAVPGTIFRHAAPFFDTTARITHKSYGAYFAHTMHCARKPVNKAVHELVVSVITCVYIEISKSGVTL